MKSAFRYFASVCMAASASASTATMTARPSLGVARARMASAAFATSRTSNYTGGSRHLQSTCSSDAVTISVATIPSSYSSDISLDAFAGCYQETGLLWLGLPYYTPSGLDLPNTYIAGVQLDSTSSAWSLGDHATGVLLCISNEQAESIHPADATWFCSGDDSGNEFVSSACGGVCEDSDPGETTCSSETVIVTSSAFPEFEGCYEPVGDESEGHPVYSMTGQVVEGEPRMMVTSITFTDGEEYPVWNLGLTGDVEVSETCFSAPSENIQHPSDESWSCDIDGDEIVWHLPSETADTPGLFEVTCGGAATTCDGAAATPASEDDDGVPAVDSEESDSEDIDSEDSDSEDSDSEDSDSEDSDSDDGRDTSSAEGGLGLAVGPAWRVVSGFVGLALATGLGLYGAV